MDSMELFAGLRNKDQAAFLYLYNEYYEQICIYANRYMNDMETAKTIADDVLVRIWDNPSGLGKNGNIKAYLLAAVKNGCMDEFRKQAREKQVYSTALVEKISGADESSFEKERMHAEMMWQIFEEIRVLPSRRRKVLELIYVQGLPTEEVAKVLKISSRNVLYRKKKGLDHLHAKFGDSFPEQLFLLLLLHTLFAEYSGN